LTDDELAIVLALAAPIAHDQRPGFVEAVVLELRAHGGELGAGASVHRVGRQLQQRFLDPPAHGGLTGAPKMGSGNGGIRASVS
jgi:hypothetical protein